MNAIDKIEDVLAKYIADPKELSDALQEIEAIIGKYAGEIPDRGRS